MPARMPSCDQTTGEVQALGVKGSGQRRIHVNQPVGHHPGQHDGNRDVQDRADRECSHDSQRQVALRPPRLFRVCRDRVKSDVGKENPPGTFGDSAPSFVFVQERMPVPGVDVSRADAHDGQDHCDIQEHHRRVEARAFPDADDQDRQ